MKTHTKHEYVTNFLLQFLPCYLHLPRYGHVVLGAFHTLTFSFQGVSPLLTAYSLHTLIVLYFYFRFQ